MRILLIDREFPPNTHGGIGAYHLMLARALGACGSFVVVLTLGTASRPVAARKPYGLLVRVPHRRPFHSALDRFPWLHDLFLGWQLAPWALRLARQHHLHIAEIPSVAGYGLPAARLLRRHLPVITRFHGSLARSPISRPAEAPYAAECRRLGITSTRRQIGTLARRPTWWLESALLNAATAVTFPSRFSRAWLISRLPTLAHKQSALIPNGVHLPRLRPLRQEAAGQPDSPRRLVFVGRVTAAKGAALLARAMPAVINVLPDVQFTLIGHQSQPRVAHQLQLLSLEFPGRIELTGRLPHRQVLERVAQSDVLLHPTYYEVCPIAPLEAMALGVPVVASDVGPMPEIVDHDLDGRLFPPGDELALANAVIDLLRSPQDLRRMGTAAAAKVESRFQLRQIIPELLHFYRRLAAGRDSAYAPKDALQPAGQRQVID